MPYLFDTDAISELLRARPDRGFARWVTTIARDDQFTSAVVIGELYRGAFNSKNMERHLENIESRVVPSVSVLPYDAAVARVYGQVAAALISAGTPLMDADLQIAATALHHGLEVVTGNEKHFGRVPDLRLQPIRGR